MNRFILPPIGKGLNQKNNAAKAAMLQQIQKGGKVKETEQEKHKRMLKAKTEEILQQALLSNKRNKGIAIPGTKEPEKKFSKTTQKVLQAMAAARLAKQAKLDAMRVVVKKKTFSNGGRVDEKGRIFTPQGKQVGQIELKNGKIKNMFGFEVGKYKDGYMTQVKISKLIETSMPKAPGQTSHPFSTFSPQAPSSSGGSVNIYSTFGDSDS
jgi:hypothetical protein